MTKKLFYSAEMAYRQGVDLDAALNHSLLAVHEYWSTCNLFEDVPYIIHGTYDGYYPTIAYDNDSGQGEQSSSTGTNELIYGAYVIRNGMSAPSVTAYHDDMPANWAPIQNVRYDIPDDYHVGLVVTSEDNSQVETATFSGVEISNGN